jgi:hypothetical protein
MMIERLAIVSSAVGLTSTTVEYFVVKKRGRFVDDSSVHVSLECCDVELEPPWVAESAIVETT